LLSKNVAGLYPANLDNALPIDHEMIRGVDYWKARHQSEWRALMIPRRND
jgi:hypothetical protein